MKQTSLETTLSAALQWVRRLMDEQGQIIHDAEEELGRMRAEQWANLPHALHEAKKRRALAIARMAELKEIRAGLAATYARFGRSRACWPHPDRKTS